MLAAVTPGLVESDPPGPSEERPRLVDCLRRHRSGTLGPDRVSLRRSGNGMARTERAMARAASAGSVRGVPVTRPDKCNRAPRGPGQGLKHHPGTFVTFQSRSLLEFLSYQSRTVPRTTACPTRQGPARPGREKRFMSITERANRGIGKAYPPRRETLTSETGSKTASASARAWPSRSSPPRSLIVVLDASIINVALPHIQRCRRGISGSGLEWVVNAYAMTFGGLLLLGGRAPGDRLWSPQDVHRRAHCCSAPPRLAGGSRQLVRILAPSAPRPPGVGAAGSSPPVSRCRCHPTFPEEPVRARRADLGVTTASARPATRRPDHRRRAHHLASWRWLLSRQPARLPAAALPRRALGSEHQARAEHLAAPDPDAVGVALLILGLSPRRQSERRADWGWSERAASSPRLPSRRSRSSRSSPSLRATPRP